LREHLEWPFHFVFNIYTSTPMQVALAWLYQRSSNILLIPGTSSVDAPAREYDGGDLNADT
jgi:diketogulonate reductase-like aldo/keto reductase